MTESAGPQLDYAPAVPRRWRSVRRALIFFLALAIGYSGWRWGPYLRDQSVILYWQRQCRNYSPPADQVVYDEDPAAAAKLLAGGGEYAVFPLKSDDTDHPASVTNAAARMPARWERYEKLAIPRMNRFDGARGAILFLHERVSPAGHRRIVCIRYFPNPQHPTREPIFGVNCQVTLIEPGTWTTPPRNIPNAYFATIKGETPPDPRVRMFAGQPDPNDPSRFTIRCEMWGQSDIIDGRLEDDDVVHLTSREHLHGPRE